MPGAKHARLCKSNRNSHGRGQFAGRNLPGDSPDESRRPSGSRPAITIDSQPRLCRGFLPRSATISRMPRFVLLYHDCPPTYERRSHWDFLLEAGDVLQTWALEQLPRDWQAVWSKTAAFYPHCPLLAEANTVPAVKLSDHRRDYLELEGPLTGDRGSVMRVAAGTYRSERDGPADWRVALISRYLTAQVSLTSAGAGDNHWLLEQTTFK